MCLFYIVSVAYFIEINFSQETEKFSVQSTIK